MNECFDVDDDDEELDWDLHVGVADAHSAKYGEGLHKVLIILREGQVIEFVDQLQVEKVCITYGNNQNKIRFKMLYLFFLNAEE